MSMIVEIVILTALLMAICWILSLLGINQLPFKIHIHHAYLGIFLVIIYFFIEKDFLSTFGIALITSDFFDHLFFIKLREKIQWQILER